MERSEHEENRNLVVDAGHEIDDLPNPLWYYWECQHRLWRPPITSQKAKLMRFSVILAQRAV